MSVMLAAGPFSIALPGQILFGRGQAAQAPALIAALGDRGLIVHGADPSRAEWLLTALRAQGVCVTALPCAVEPTLPMLTEALATARRADPLWVAALAGVRQSTWARRWRR
nr:iron-containing alcohol dehydrogenase [Paracoccus jeotgali]